MSTAVDILLSTYNGAEYLADQVDSILQQTFCNWHLIVRDDGSSDGTQIVIDRYQQRYPDKITKISDSYGTLGPAQSFAMLMQRSSSPYIAFCDQDDVWLPNKLKQQQELLVRAEAQMSENCPLLVHSDLIVADQKLAVLSRSFWEYQNIAPGHMSSLTRLLVQNYVTGCACLFNRALLKLSLPMPKNVIMHDWWLALIAMSQGQIINMSEPTIMYRQHDKNDTGAKHWGCSFIVKSIARSRDLQMQGLLKTRVQAKALLNTNILNEENRKTVERYILMYSKNWLKRRIEMIRMGFFKYGLIRNIAMFLRI